MKKAIYTLIIIPIIFFSVQVFGSFSIARFDNQWCSAIYPTTYVTGSFSITETGINGQDGFSKSQTNATLQIDLPTGFEFRTVGSLASVTATGTEVTIVSFSYSSATRLFVTISTLSNNIQFNTISFNNFEIRAMNGNASGSILRSGGTFKIDNSTANPTSSESFGILSSLAPFVYTTSSVTQPNLMDIKQYTINNNMLRIKISGNGNCGGSVTQFTFSTDGNNGTGTDSVRNITTAKIYYTGNSSVFATTSYFGFYTAPSGNFVISGAANLLNGDNYFWLCYDVPGDAYTGIDGNKMDASLISFAINGSLKTDMITPTPSGHRNVIPSEFYYSRISGNWTSNIWSIINNGPLCNCQPNGGGIAIIDTGNVVTMNVTRTVDVMQVMKDASLIGQSASITFNAATALITYDNGYFIFLGDIIVNGNVTLNGSGISEFHKELTIGGDLFIASAATLTNMASSVSDLRIGGNININGFLENTGAHIILVGGNSFIDGTGRISSSYVEIINGGKTVKSTANLYIDASLQILGPYMVDNFGKMNIRGNMDADNAVSHWFNETGSELSYGGSINMFATNGYLAAFSDFNTVHYSGITDQTIVIAQQSTYYNLALEGSGTKLMLAETHLHGNFICNAVFGDNQKTLIADGIRMQYFSGTVPPTLYNLTVNNTFPVSALTLNIVTTVNGILTLQDGHIITTRANILVLGIPAIVSIGTTPDSSFVRGPMIQTYNSLSSVTKIFPVGKGNIMHRADLTITQTNTTATQDTVEFFYSSATALGYTLPATLSKVSDIDYWDIGVGSPTNVSTASIQLCFFPIDVVTDIPNLRVAKSDDAGNWLDIGAAGAAGAKVLTGTINSSANFTKFSIFSLANAKDGSNNLPIELLSFDAKSDNDLVNITWATTSETNNNYFTIEKSMDAEYFEMVTIVGGAGNSNILLNYSAKDNEPLPGVSYYRLKQTDFDGKFSFSDIVKVDFSKSIEVTIYPNPFSTYAVITINDASLNNDYVLRIYNVLGTEVMNRIVTNQSTTIETSILPTGIYSYNVFQNNKNIQSGKLIAQQ